MNEIEFRIEKNLLPFDDASGYRFRVELLRNAEGASIRIHQHDDYTEINSEYWKEVRDVIERMLNFMSDEAQSLAPGAEVNFSNEPVSDAVQLKQD